MIDLKVVDAEGNPVGQAKLNGYMVTEEQYRALLNFSTEKAAIQREKETMARELASLKASTQRQIRLANDMAQKAIGEAAEKVQDQINQVVEEALALERKAQHMRITTEALKPLLQAAKAYTSNLPKAKRRA